MKIQFKDLKIGEKFDFKSNTYTKMASDRAKAKISDIVSYWYIFKENDLVTK